MLVPRNNLISSHTFYNERGWTCELHFICCTLQYVLYTQFIIFTCCTFYNKKFMKNKFDDKVTRGDNFVWSHNCINTIMWSPLVLLLLATPSLCLPQCRCTPNQECWPTQSDWDLLNVTVSGRLSRPVSPVSPCLGETINSQDCRESLERLGQDPFWLQTMPGGTESTGKEAVWSNLKAYCFLT